MTKLKWRWYALGQHAPSYCPLHPAPSHCLSAAPCSPRSLWTNFVNFSSCSHSMHNAFFSFSSSQPAFGQATLSHKHTYTHTLVLVHTVAHTAEFLMNSNERLLRLLGQTRCAVAVSAPKRAGEHFTCALQVAASLPRCTVASRELRAASCDCDLVS